MIQVSGTFKYLFLHPGAVERREWYGLETAAVRRIF
jgi:hypothetical protein